MSYWGSEVNGVGATLGPVGVWGERPVIHEVHERSRRYPEPLMPVEGVRVDGFTVSLNVELPSNPEAGSARLGQLLDLLSNLVEHEVGRFNASAVRQEK